jgi:hypothetical protein
MSVGPAFQPALVRSSFDRLRTSGQSSPLMLSLSKHERSSARARAEAR